MKFMKIGNPWLIPWYYRGYALNKTGPWLFIAQCSTNCIPVTLPVAVLAAALWQPAPWRKKQQLRGTKQIQMPTWIILYTYIYMYIIMYVYKDISWLWLRDSYTKSKSPKRSLVYWNLAIKTWWMFHSSNWRILPIYWFPPPPCLVFASPCFKKLLKFQQLLILTIHTCQGGFSQGAETEGCVSLS